MKLTMIAVAALSAGCVSTPAEIRDAGERHTFASRQAPRVAAHCLGRAVENFNDALAASIKELNHPDAYEIVVRVMVGASRPAVVMELEPVADGSTVQLWVAPHMSADRFVAMAKSSGC